MPVAVSNATALDTVLSYLLIAAGLDDSEVLEDIAEATGPVGFADPSPPVGELGPDGPFPS